MRIINIFSAFSGAFALIMLAASHHGGGGEGGIVMVAGLAQLSAAAAGLAVANRAGRLNLIAGAVLLAGAMLFAGPIYLAAFHIYALHALTPIGGGLLILGWLTLAFAKPGAKTGV